MMRTDVVVTGIGCLGPWGIGLPALAAALQRGEPLGRPVDRSAGYHRPHSATLVGSCGELDLAPWLSPKAARRMSDMSQFGVATAHMGLHDAGLVGMDGERSAITVSTAFGPSGFTELLARQILEKGGKAASPFLFTDCVANAAAGQIAIDLGSRGPNTTICAREAGPLLAIGHAANDINLGRVDRSLAGSIDEMKALTHAILDRFRALARPHCDGELPRPFDRRRAGILAAEGATLLVLEAASAARARGARILARVGGHAHAFDPTAGRASFGHGASALAATLQQQLGPRLGEVDVVVSGASGARRGDALEAEVLRTALPHRPPVLVPKAVHGEYGGGTLAAAMLALRGAEFAHPSACSEPDAALGINPASGRITGRRVLCSALASGGGAAWLILEAP